MMRGLPPTPPQNGGGITFGITAQSPHIRYQNQNPRNLLRSRGLRLVDPVGLEPTTR